MTYSDEQLCDQGSSKLNAINLGWAINQLYNVNSPLWQHWYKMYFILCFIPHQFTSYRYLQTFIYNIQHSFTNYIDFHRYVAIHSLEFFYITQNSRIIYYYFNIPENFRTNWTERHLMRLNSMTFMVRGNRVFLAIKLISIHRHESILIKQNWK